MAATPKFAHVVLQTSRLDEMRDWYCALLDGHVVFENGALSFVTFDEEHHRIAFIAPPVQLEAKSPLASGMHHVAYTFASLDDLLDRYANLKERGIEPHVPVQHGVTTSLYYRDPDGNFVELQVDNFATPDEATAYMSGPEYSEDPVGVGFEPDKMAAALRAGTEQGELMTRRWALTTSPGMPNPLEAMSR
ncbi:VOC family protein [Pseudonocardia spinosispora]|uniref:VOC family protein n=1 Tax=Pseudonocardia spinosispora TaxID=103441 RepID=UPI0003FAF36F|nr:VOC family protein [Pseudonocardia spinosispora]